jgi:hypothetical protein
VSGGEIEADELPIGDHGLAAHEQVTHAAVGSEHEAGDGISDVSEIVARPHCQVGNLSRLETPQLGAAETSGAA